MPSVRRPPGADRRTSCRHSTGRCRMKPLLHGFALLSITLSTFFSGSSAQATPSRRPSNDAYTVRLKDGQVFEQARVSVNWNFLVLSVRQVRQPEKSVAFDSIESITDADGKDVTDSMLRRYSPRLQEREEGRSPSRPRSALALPTEAPPWRVGLLVTPTYAIPFGTWLDGTQSHAGVRALLSVGVNHDLTIDLGYQHQPLGVDQ